MDGEPREIRRALFVSDLHLSDADPAGIQWFSTFTRWIDKSVCEELFILGDLFDYWVGPKQMELPGYQPVLQSISNLVARGIPVTVLCGNRDVYLEGRFSERTGATVGEDLTLLRAGGKRVLLMHGDLLCTRDRSYQRFRRVMRSRLVTGLAPRLPLWLGLFFARGLRGYSKRVVPQKLPAEKGIVEDTVRDYLRRTEADLLICGHVHCQEDRPVEVDGSTRRLIVLPAFDRGEPPLVYRDVFAFADRAKLGSPS